MRSTLFSYLTGNSCDVDKNQLKRFDNKKQFRLAIFDLIKVKKCVSVLGRENSNLLYCEIVLFTGPATFKSSRDSAGVKKCQNLDLLFDNNFDIQIKNLASENEGKCQQDKFDRPPPVNSIR